MMRLIEVEIVLVANKSKNRQKDKKPQRPESCKGYWFGETFTKALILHQLDTKNSYFYYNFDNF